MKYKHCPDCGNHFSHWKSSDNWSETYQCAKCKLEIQIAFGEPMHAAGDKETWIRPKPPEPREWWIDPKDYPDVEFEKDRVLNEKPVNPAWIHVREVIE